MFFVVYGAARARDPPSDSAQPTLSLMFITSGTALNTPQSPGECAPNLLPRSAANGRSRGGCAAGDDALVLAFCLNFGGTLLHFAIKFTG